ncbi:MAG: ribonuclease [Candidatus Eremiobacteraeota bacterium]|nr:ribonuclease [Candidatus Eremiobacteraeota bacterium]
MAATSVERPVTTLPTDILISSDPWENRVAILEEGRLAEIYVEREERVIGSIYKGKVVNVLPGMGASFVDIGLGRNAFLYVDDINKTPLNIGDVEVTSGRTGYTITEKVSRGDDVLVQIVKEPRGLKGARVSTNISLPGRYLILMPTGKFSGVSRKIESADERNRLKTIMKAIRPEGMATVVRTAAGGVSSAELIADLGVLIRMWHGILEQYKALPSPALLHKDMNLVYKTARDFISPHVQNVWLDDAKEVDDVKDFMRMLGPQFVDRIKYYEGGKKLFADFKIDEEIQRLMKPTVKLPSGGSIVIESTEALTVVDVNSGKFTGGKNLDDTIVRTNVEAATEVARQVRLRDIGGIIVCDFIDMSSESDRNRVITALQEGLRKDRTRSTIQSFSPLGLLEFTRKRVGKDLGQQLRGKCPTCEGLGSVMSPESVTIGAFREILGHVNGAAKHVHIAAAPSVAAQAEYWYEDERVQLAERVGTHIDVFVDPAVHPERPRIIWGDDKLPTLGPIRVGDEFEVELLTIRLPNPTSAAAIVAGRLIEVENAANAAGKLIKIRILDVDGSDILAEPRSPVEAATAIGEARSGKKRRRGGRGRKRELTPAEQADELRALAEEAEKGLGGRTAIGISTAEEVSAKKAGPKTTAQKAAEGGVALLPGESLSGARVGGILPGEKLSGSRARGSGTAAPPASTPIRPPTTPAAAASAAAASGEAESEGQEGHGRRRRRRRRGGRSGGAEVAAHAAAPAAAAAIADPADLEDDEDEAAVAGQGHTGAAGENGDRKRRRRRRRRRGGRGAAGDGQAVAASEQTAVPDRHIFRVDPEGAAHATGETAPPVPSRALAPWNRKRGDVAVEAPPPVITAPPQRGETVKTTRPSRRRRTGAADEAPHRIGGQLEAGAPVRALPAPQPAKAAPAAAAVEPRRGRPRRRGEPALAAVVAAPAPAPAEVAPAKRTTRARKPEATPVAADVPNVKPTARARKTGATATAAPPAKKAAPAAPAAAKKSPARKATAKKAAAAKPAAGAKKAASGTRKAPAAKKATTTRKKS